MIPFATGTSIAIFLTIWFVVLFAVLPFGIHSQHESGSFTLGTDPGAPVAPRLFVKFLWTTGLSVLVFAALVAIVRLLSYDGI